MGNNIEPTIQNTYTEPTIQNTYKICMVCNKNNILNTELINLSKYFTGKMYNDGDHQLKLLLRCSKGHILEYYGSSEHINECYNYIERNSNKNMKNEQSLSEIDKLRNECDLLKNEINLLKKQIEKTNNNDNNNLKNIIPSAPPLNLNQQQNMESNTINGIYIQDVEDQIIE